MWLTWWHFERSLHQIIVKINNWGFLWIKSFLKPPLTYTNQYLTTPQAVLSSHYTSEAPSLSVLLSLSKSAPCHPPGLGVFGRHRYSQKSDQPLIFIIILMKWFWQSYPANIFFGKMTLKSVILTKWSLQYYLSTLWFWKSDF